MVRKSFAVIRHSAVMVLRTRKSYFMLSITIILSFSLLLGYLIYSDSAQYNVSKETFLQDRNVVVLKDSHLDNQKMQMLLKQTSMIENTWNYIWYQTGAVLFSEGRLKLNEDHDIIFPRIRICLIPNDIWDFYDIGVHRYLITYLDERNESGITLHSGEAIMDEYTFQLLGLDDREESVYPLQLTEPNYGKTISLPIKVVATVRYDDHLHMEVDKDGNTVLDYEPMLILSLEDLNLLRTLPSLDWDRGIVFYSETPELVQATIDKIDFVEDGINVYETQNASLERKQEASRIKAIITAALLLLLGINLYSTFTNALNDRKFEIGVKRAIGANSWEIIRQFLYESLLVMLTNIVVSIVAVTNVFIVYKLIYESIPDQMGGYHKWIIYVSPYSIAMFAICSVSLTLVFSIIFSYKSTQVEIVKYLKSE